MSQKISQPSMRFVFIQHMHMQVDSYTQLCTVYIYMCAYVCVCMYVFVCAHACTCVCLYQMIPASFIAHNIAYAHCFVVSLLFICCFHYSDW